MHISGLEKLRISHSSRKMLNDGCGQKFYFYKLFKQPKNHSMEGYAGMVGKALHVGWQSHLTHGDREKAIADMLLAWDVRVMPGKFEARTLEASYITLETIMDFTESDIEWSLARIKHNGVEKPAVEIPFEIRFMEKGKPFTVANGIPVTYIGYIDALMFSNMTGAFKVRDLKTHRRWQEDLRPLYMFDEQCLSYQLVIEAALGNKLENFDIDYLAAYVDVSKPSIYPYPFTKGRDLIQDWARGLYIDLMNLRTYLELSWFPRKSSHCMGYNGEVCRFIDVCGTRDDKYYREYFELGKHLEYPEKEFEPWFVLDLELSA